MGKLEYYNNLKEKEDKFRNFERIDTKEQFDSFYTSISDQLNDQMGNLFFRGVTEAKYKLYNSAQRVWITKELNNWQIEYLDIIQEIVTNAKAWCNGLLNKFYKAFGRKAYDIPVLSFLQHYGAPTPLLDWTYSLDISLFFGINDLKYTESNIDIDNYFSIYIIVKNKKTGKNNELIDIRDIYKPDSDSNINFNNEINEDIKLKLSENKRSPNRYLFAFKQFRQLKLFYISDFKRLKNKMILIEDKGSYNEKTLYSNTNFNIINQQGLFIFNSDPNIPIEDIFTGGISEANNFSLAKINCVNIHKNLYEYIYYELFKKGITKNYIYPQEEKLASDSIKYFLNFDKIK